MTPLDEFKTRWQAVMPIPYIEVINLPVETDGLPDLWGTGLLQSQTRVDVSLGSNPHVEETGDILAALFARSGTGGNSLDAAVAALRLHFAGYMTLGNQLQFKSVNGPPEIDPMADGEWWRQTFLVSYLYWTRRVEPVAP